MPSVQHLHKTASAPPPAPRTPERQALADAIAKREAAERHLAKIAAAFEQADATSTDTFRALKQARIGLEDAQQNERANIVAAALNEVAGTSIDEAKAALAKAESDHDAAMKTVEALKAERDQAEQRRRWAEQAVNDAVAATLRTSHEVEQLIADLDVALRATSSIVSKLTPLMQAGAVDQIDWDLRKYEPDKHADAIWQAAVAKLREDADAPLPPS